MAKLEFKDLTFEERQDEIIITFLRLFYFTVDKKDLKKIGDFTVSKHEITFKNIGENKANKKFNNLLSKGFNILKNRLTDKKAVYIHQNSGIPLIGSISFGLIDRNTSIIEIKPITSCNLDCTYCSVDQNKRLVDFVVEEEYLVNELKKLIEFKAANNIEAHIASQGEPTLYEPLSELVRNISKIPQITTISIDTNGTLLTKDKVDELIQAGLTRFNLSINALDQGLAKSIANGPYNINKIKEIARYIAKRSNLIITPVLIPGVNEKEMPKLVEFAKNIKADIGIQNLFNYRLGKNPVKEMPFNLFLSKLKSWETQYNIKLIKTEQDFNIKKTKPLPKPFRKREVVKADIVGPGRFKNEKIAVSKQRTISIPNCYKKGQAKIRITRTKHNIFIGELV
jgi:uncharacterized Fe-S cluster-containing radical SAM superfamily enzyme|tara:strand:+ start:254 stop:1444 length:1191 start_codon:yes stop_codon:yes gene_type:complete